MDMERCYPNTSPITASFMKNVLDRQLSDVIRNEYGLDEVYPKRANTDKIQGEFCGIPVTTIHRGQHVRA